MRALLARALIAEFPDYYRWYAQREYTYNGITQHNRNLLLWRDPSVDGLKTGHTDDAGYCLVASAERSGMRLVSAVMGTASEEGARPAVRRCSTTASAFLRRTSYIPAARRSPQSGSGRAIAIASSRSRRRPLRHDSAGELRALSAEMHVPATLAAPLAASAPVGEVAVALEGETLARAPLVAIAPAVPAASGASARRRLDVVRVARGESKMGGASSRC